MLHARMTTLLIYIFLITSPYQSLNSFLKHSSADLRYILMILDRITEQVSAKCRMQE